MSATIAPDIPPPPAPAPKPRVKRLRLLAILFAVLLLGLVSFVFGVFISIVSDLPSLTRFAQFKEAKSSVLLDDTGNQIGTVSQQNRVIVTAQQIPAIVKEAVISIEDKRFETNSGIDLRGIVRALVADITHGSSVQGASTIEQQFIKNALQAQSHRTILEKLREAALAFQLSHKWSKEKILTAYLNTIYFGNGAYGIEAAAETYFGHDVNHEGCGTPGHQLCVEQLAPWEAALLAGIIQSPTAYDPVNNQVVARERRNLVLRDMLEQGYLTRAEYQQSIAQALPAPHEVQAPSEQMIEGVDVGYFTSWVQQQVIERYGQRAFYGGLRVKTTLDLSLQRAAEQAINNYLEYAGGPSASLVAIENATGKVRAMVGGRDYNTSPFNLATEGERQPGSSFKAFDLAAALEDGISPESVWESRRKVFFVNGPNGREKFVVHNDEGAYSGSNTLTGATTFSDNSIYAEVGLKVGTRRIARLARRMGITTPISTNASMTIGGLTVGVTPLDMAHAYETIAHGGERVSGTLSEGSDPVGIEEVSSSSGRDIDHTRTARVLPHEIAETETSMLETVLQYGTGRAAAIGQFAAGKTGTTSNYGDAWFVGWDSRYTVAVWVGYPNKLVPMTTDFNGQPVLGGTFPALIWHDFMVSALQVEKERAERAREAQAHSGKHGAKEGEGQGSSGGEGGAPPTQTSRGAPAPSSHGNGNQAPAPATTPRPSVPAPATGQGEAGGGEKPEAPAAPSNTSHEPASGEQGAPAASSPSSPPTSSAGATGGSAAAP
jgi:penicillin-binding protein 1A